MQLETRQDFLRLVEYPHIFVFYIYFVVKYVIILIEVLPKIIQRCRFCDQLYSICSCCCCTQYFIKFIRWVVKLIFGAEEGIVHIDGDYIEDNNVDDNKIPTLFIRNQALTYKDIVNLGILIFSFLLLSFITFWDMFWVSITDICTTDPEIYCFPFNNSNSVNLNFTTDDPITDCSLWKSYNASFDCYKLVYNFEGAFGAIGGLFTFFILGTKIASAVAVAFAEKCCKCSCCLNGCFRIPIAIVFSIFDVYFAIFIGFLASPNERPLLREIAPKVFVDFIQTHGNQVILFFGIIGTSLLLPLENYIKQKDNSNMQLRPLEAGYESITESKTADSNESKV